ncbi:tetratricopeptide repeat protein [Thalassospira marina]|uniref:Tetratricopeptide repeat protein n=1 Tax=Thalassospira marina TaxID=2048283 RepID=A0ABM6QAE7_9PROT|nr:hypothetical protein [Thalassospira marina]AUG53492.1 hypothetical protein CSC3H3_12785 [Thalassospira marina]
MIQEYIKKRVIKELMAEIACLSPTDLELVGQNVVAMRENKRMVHHGINKDYKPVGHTVDGFSDDSSLVAEYSTEHDYFKDCDSTKDKKSPSFPKPEKDIIHAIGHRLPQGPDKIYLISSQEEPPSFRAKFNATPLATQHGGIITILDSRELAKEVYQQSIAVPDCANFYTQFFPGFSQNLDNYEYYGKLPAQCEGYVPEQEADAALMSHFKTNSICVLHGVSGSGKTQAAIRFTRDHSDQFENYIWITGDDWKDATALSAVKRSRGGAPVNIPGLFNASKTILVIDGLERPINKSDFDELQGGFQKEGVVIVTSQTAILEKDCCVQIPEMSIETATQILGEDRGNCTEEALDFIGACKFNPLILSVIRAIISQEGVDSNDLYKEILASPNDLFSRDGQSIMKKILSRLDDNAIQALKKIANSGIATHDLEFLRQFIGIANSQNLRQISILLPTSVTGVVRVHDLVCSAVQDRIDGEELVNAIQDFIAARNGEMAPSVLREIHLCSDLLQAILAKRSEIRLDWLSYALLQIEGDAKQSLCKDIEFKKITPELPLSEVMCLIDAKEAYAYTIEDQDKRKLYYENCANQFSEALENQVSPDVAAELLHHRGKAFRRCGEHKVALDSFNELLKLRPEWHATHGQIAHLGMQYGADAETTTQGEQSIRILIDEMTKDSSSVPLRVSLAALARLRSYGAVVKDISNEPDQVQKLADIIALSALEGFGQFYEAFVSFTSKFGYQFSTVCVQLAERLPEILAMPIQAVGANQWVSACEALTNTADAAHREGKERLSKRLREACLQFADEISSSDKIKPYDARAVAKAYNAAVLPRRALETIGKVPDEEIDHWVLYRKAEAELALEKKDDALQSASEALKQVIADDRAKIHVPSYYLLLSLCHEKLGNNAEATKAVNHALADCQSDKYKNELLERLSMLGSS